MKQYDKNFFLQLYSYICLRGYSRKLLLANSFLIITVCINSHEAKFAQREQKHQ